MKNRVLALTAALLLSACSHSSDSSSPPRSAAEALKRLSDSDRGSLERWEARLAKDCDANEAFDNPSDETSEADGPKGYDAGILLKSLSHSLLVPGDRDTFAILGEPSYPYGQSQSRIDRSQQVNGQETRALHVELRRDGGRCVVEVFGQKVYETTIVTSFPIVGYWDPDRTDLKPVPAKMTVSPGPGELGLLTGHGFDTALMAALTPVEAARALVQSKLGLTEAQAKGFLVIAAGQPLGASMALKVDPKAETTAEKFLPFNLEHPEIIGPTASLSELAGVPGSVPVELAIQPRHFTAGSETNAADQGVLWNLEAEIRTERSGSIVASLKIGNRAPLSDGVSAQCFDRRFEALQSLSRLEEQFRPALSDATAACDAFSHDFDGALLADPGARASFARLFAGVQGEHGRDYVGWDNLYRAFALRVIESGHDVARVLDPDAKSPLIDEGSRELEAVLADLPAYPALSEARAAFLNMALTWSLDGDSVASEKIDSIFKALSNSIVPFRRSTLSLLDSLAQAPAGQDEALVFAAGLASDYKSLGARIIESSSKLGLGDWADQALGGVLQQKLPRERLARWSATLDGAAAFTAREQGRLAGEPSTFIPDSNRRALLERAMGESWSPEAFPLLEKIAAFEQAYRIGCSMYKDLSSVASCMGSGFYSAQPGKVLSPAFEGRYGRLTDDFTGYLAKLPESEFFATRSELTQHFFDPLWSRCDNVAFGAHQTQLHALIDLLASEPDALKRMQFESQIRDQLQDCR